jgi:nucleotide-binding universal stress UspA family protein
MYKRVLVPVDGSETSNRALTAALQLARNTSGRVRLVHVVDELAYVSGYDQYGGSSGQLIKIIRESGAKILDDAVAIAQAAGVEAEKVIFDNLGERLGEIVVGTHGRRGVGRVLLGSGAEQIIRLAPVPVLVVRTRESEGDTKAVD